MKAQGFYSNIPLMSFIKGCFPNKFKIFIGVFIFIIWMYACKKDAPIAPLDLGYNYFPTQIGSFVIYDVDSIVHNDFTGKIDTFKYQIKEIIDTVYLDNSNRPTLRIERYKKNYNKSIPYSSIPWTLKNVCSGNRTKSSAEKVEENQRFVKLVFPIRLNAVWNGNIFNSMREWTYTYKEVNQPGRYGSLAFDSTLQVIQINSENKIYKKYFQEIYAKNVGIVYKEIIDVVSDTIIQFIPVMKRISSGLEFKMTISSYGN